LRCAQRKALLGAEMIGRLLAAVRRDVARAGNVKQLAVPRTCDITADCRKQAADHFCTEKGFALGASQYDVTPGDAAFRSISCATL